jgi:hypothetical protein
MQLVKLPAVGGLPRPILLLAIRRSHWPSVPRSLPIRHGVAAELAPCQKPAIEIISGRHDLLLDHQRPD